jgi:hypothetical protein
MEALCLIARPTLRELLELDTPMAEAVATNLSHADEPMMRFAAILAGRRGPR